MRLGTTKTSGAEGVHHLAPISVAHLLQRRDEQAEERRFAADRWIENRYEGEVVSLVFTTSAGVDLADVARYVGQSNTSTTAGYISSLGKRPASTAQRAAELLDPSFSKL
jgi:hypothetical protein